jgi:DNA primase
MSRERYIIREAALPDLRRSGGRLRASCPIHRSDHQRSLSIEETGDYAGFGRCFACGAEVLVEEMNPDAARRLAAIGERLTTPERLLRPIKRHHAEAAPWQQEERAALEALEPRMRRALLASERARAYLAGRGIPLELAEAQGVGYIPPEAAKLPELRPLQKWVDRLIFPLSSPDGRGYAGRSLHLWQPGMDENAHKARLAALADQEQAASEAAHQRGDYLPVLHRRWEKTFPAGWYGLADLAPDSELVMICEGPFDRLALVAAGLWAENIVALVGSRDGRAGDWLPARVQRALIALDGDEKGQEAAQALALRLPEKGIACAICIPPDDGQGKDWSERWRLGQHAALWLVHESLDELVAR